MTISNTSYGGGQQTIDIMPIKIPTNRKVIQTIKINNGILTFEQDSSGNKYWFRNGNLIPKSQYNKYKFYDKNMGAYQELSDVGSKIHTPNIDRLVQLNDSITGARDFSSVYNRAKASNKEINLKTKGRMNLATIPINMLDSIAINSGRANTPFKLGLGLVGKESTFGGYSNALGNPWGKDGNFGMHQLTNNHAFFDNKYNDYLTSSFLNFIDDSASDEEVTKSIIKREADVGYALSHPEIINRYGTKIYNPNNVMADAFMRYNAAPNKYNSGQKNYSQMVTNIGNEVWSDPQIQQYWDTRGKQFYFKGHNESLKNKKLHLEDM